MNRFLKWMVFTCLFIAIALVGGSIALTHFLDPNQYKDLIVNSINEKTDYHASLNGKMDWTLFPTLGLSVRDVIIKARPEAENAFLKLDQATVSVKLMPLLEKNIQIDALSIRGLSLDLQTDTQGRNNWESTVRSAKKTDSNALQPEVINTLASTEAKKAKPSAFNMDIAAIELTDSHITYSDLQKSQTITLANVNAHVSDLSNNTPATAEIKFIVTTQDPNLKGNVEIKSNIAINHALGIYEFNQSTLESELTGQGLEKSVSVKLMADTTLDLSQRRLAILNLLAQYANFNLNGHFEKNLRTQEYKGHVAIPAFDLNELKDNFPKNNSSSNQEKLDATQKNKPVTLALEGDLVGNKNYAFLNDTQILLNDIPLSARLGITSFDTLGLDITVNGSQVDLETLLIALGKEPRFSGLINFSTRLTTREAKDALKTLNGNGQFEVFNGVLKGENLTAKICEAVALANKEQSTSPQETDTHFETLKGTFVVQNGVIHSKDLFTQMKAATANTTLKANLIEQKIDADIGVTIHGDSDDMACHVNEKYQNVALPITCKGHFDTEPGKMCEVDRTGLLKVMVSKGAEKLQDKVGPAVNDLLDKILGN